jgi:hypothetical protein
MRSRVIDRLCYTIMALIGVMAIADSALLAYSLVTG